MKNRREAAWLIENKQGTYFGVNPKSVLPYTSNFLGAIRFARREDAEHMITFLVSNGGMTGPASMYFASEHVVVFDEVKQLTKV